MQQVIMLGGAVSGADGTNGQIDGLVINPNRGHLDYLILQGPAGETFVPSGDFQLGAGQSLALRVDRAELEHLPHPHDRPEQGTLIDNLPDLCVVRAGTQVHTIGGDALGTLRGVQIDADQLVHALVLDQSPGAAVPITRIARHNSDDSVVQVELASTASRG
jgi:hypothetical protein